jgi:hypothetical protein
MKINFKTIIYLLLIVVTWGCSKKNENYKKLSDGEIYYPGVIFKPSYRAGNLRTLLVWLDSMIVTADSHNPTDTIKVLVPGLKEGTYNFTVNSEDKNGRLSIAISINGVRVYGPIYQSGIFNRGYNADNPFIVDIPTGKVQLKFNQIKLDSVTINTKTVVNYVDNSGNNKSVVLKPADSVVTINDFQFGTDITYRSSYLPFRGAIDTFTVTTPTTFPKVRRVGDVTALYIKNPGYPFYRSDNGTGKWGLPKDWQYNTNVLNQDGGNGGGWSTDNGGVIHFEAKDYSGDGVNNGKVYQTISLPAGSYALDVETAGSGGTINANEIVAVGTTLPDINNIGSPLALYHGDQNSIGGTHTLSFTLTQPTTVTIGWVVSTGSYTYLQFKGLKLRSI